MVYVSRRSEDLLEGTMKRLREKGKTTPSRIVKADMIHAALEDYAKKIFSKGL